MWLLVACNWLHKDSPSASIFHSQLDYNLISDFCMHRCCIQISHTGTLVIQHIYAAWCLWSEISFLFHTKLNPVASCSYCLLFIVSTQAVGLCVLLFVCSNVFQPWCKQDLYRWACMLVLKSICACSSWSEYCVCLCEKPHFHPVQRVTVILWLPYTIKALASTKLTLSQWNKTGPAAGMQSAEVPSCCSHTAREKRGNVLTRQVCRGECLKLWWDRQVSDTAGVVICLEL